MDKLLPNWYKAQLAKEEQFRKEQLEMEKQEKSAAMGMTESSLMSKMSVMKEKVDKINLRASNESMDKMFGKK